MNQRKGLQSPGSIFCHDSEKGARSIFLAEYNWVTISLHTYISVLKEHTKVFKGTFVNQTSSIMREIDILDF